MFTGFPEETIRFFLDLRFHNNSAFFEENRERYRQEVVAPFSAFIEEIGPAMLKIDPQMELRPYKCMARIRRDTRFSRDKSPYRDHLWVLFRRAGEPRELSVNYWFEFGPGKLGWGLGFWGENRPAMDALRRRLEHPALGYTMHDDADDTALIDYYFRHHGVSVKPEDLVFTPGVVDSLLLAVHALTGPEDKVLIQTPVYGPFYSVIRRAGREIVENPMIETASGRWEMDLDDLDKKLEGVRLMLLCSPHNPTGRVWERETLQKVADLCKAHGVYLVADEIHCDFAFDRKHTSALTLEGAERGIGVAVSATKTFNIAGLKHSTFLLPDPQMREMVKKKADEIGMGGGNLLGVIATSAAYTTGDAWLKEVRALIVRNRDHAAEALLEAGAKVYPNEGTYLMWLDLRAFGMDCETLYRRLMDEAKVRLNKGTDFGAAGEGFMRLNLATTPDLCRAVRGRAPHCGVPEIPEGAEGLKDAHARDLSGHGVHLRRRTDPAFLPDGRR